MADQHVSSFESTITSLRKHNSIKKISQALSETEEAQSTSLLQTITDDIEAFTESRNPDVVRILEDEVRQLTNELVRLVGGGKLDNFEFVKSFGHRRAEQRFPLETMLHAFRICQKAYIQWLRECITSTIRSSRTQQQITTTATDFIIEYIHITSTFYASSYLEQTRILAESAGDRRAELLRILLDGYDESDGRVASILREAGFLDGRQAFCVCLAQPREPTEMRNPARVNRLVDAMHEGLANVCTQRVIGVRENKVVCVLSDFRRISGYAHARESLAARAASALELVGPTILFGVSADVVSTSQIPSALEQAALSFMMADDLNRVVSFSEISMQRFLLHIARTELKHVLPPWAAEFIKADRKAKGKLIETLQAYADGNMNVLKTSEILNIHPNTIYARFKRIEEITGLQPRDFHPLSELLVIAVATT